MALLQSSMMLFILRSSISLGSPISFAQVNCCNQAITLKTPFSVNE